MVSVPARFVERIEKYIAELEKKEEKSKRAAIYHRKAADFWNSRIEWLNPRIDADEFKWSQLVWQEIAMWAAMAEPVTKEDYDFIVHRRGFNEEQKQFLSEALIEMGIKGFD